MPAGNNSTVITSNTTTNILSGIGNNAAAGFPAAQGLLVGVSIGAPGAAGGTVTIYDNTSAAGTPVFQCSIGAAALTPVFIPLNIQLKTGLTVVTTGMTSPNVTVLWI